MDLKVCPSCEDWWSAIALAIAFLTFCLNSILPVTTLAIAEAIALHLNRTNLIFQPN